MTPDHLTLSYPKDKLVEIIESQREEHVHRVARSTELYRRTLIDRLREKIAKVESMVEVSHHISITKPIDKTDEYDAILMMLRLSDGEQVELTERQFRCFVLNQWERKDAYTESTACYVDEID